MAAVSQELLEAVQKAAADNRLSCSHARKLAEELNVSVREVGEACDQLKIKLYACELGCF